MNNADWMVGIGGACAFLHSVVMGATMPAQCWGAVLGAKVVQYRTALVLGVIGQAIGMTAFGPENYTVFSGLLNDWMSLQPYPRLTLYTLMWITVTPIAWHFLSIWRKILLPGYLATIASTVGASFIFPGAHHLEIGSTSEHPPFLTGLGPVFFVWALAPAVTIINTAVFYLGCRNYVFRGDDVLHRALWCLPVCISGASTLGVLLVIYAIGSPRGTTVFETTPQGTCVIMAAVGIGTCLVSTMLVPCISRRMSRRMPAPVAVRRMNLLGLDEATMQELAADEASKDIKGWMQRIYSHLFQPDLFASISKDERLMHIHSSAEEFEPIGEAFFVPGQIVASVLLSVAYGAINGHTAFGIFALMRHIQDTGQVPRISSLGMQMRCVSAVALSLGAVLFGGRIVPVTGVQLVKMTPFRSNVATFYTLETLAILSTVDLKGGVISYAAVSAVIAVGLVEGFSHVNWKMFFQLIWWWTVGFLVVVLSTAALVAQGMYSPSLVAAGD